MAPAATPTPADLDRQAARLRDQAAGLNRRKADKTEADEADYGQRVDEAQRTAASARAAADSATKQANELQDKAQEMMNTAKRFEDDAQKEATEAGPSGDFGADNYRDQAKSLRAAATGMTRRAERAQQEAQRQLDVVDRAERDASQIRRAHFDQMDVHDQLRLTGASLEDKARELELAAKDMRAADHTYVDDAKKAELTKSAQDHLAAADRIKPDFSRIDPQDIVAAGIPMIEVPGAELINPYAPDPDAPVPPVDVHDDDLLPPDAAADPVNPVPDAPAVAAVAAVAPDAAADPVEPVDPDAQPGLADDGAGDPFVDPLDVGTSDAAGDTVDTGSEAPAADVAGLSDPLDQAPADLAGDPDPYGDVGFGLAAVDTSAGPAPVAEAETSFGQDTYVDQPDVGSTSSYGGDAYGDVADDVTNEYIA